MITPRHCSDTIAWDLAQMRRLSQTQIQKIQKNIYVKTTRRCKTCDDGFVCGVWVYEQKKKWGRILLVANETANRHASPAHATHQTASNALSPWAVVCAIGVDHRNGLGASRDKRVLATAAHGRVYRAGSHIGGGLGVAQRRRTKKVVDYHNVVSSVVVNEAAKVFLVEVWQRLS